MIYNDWWWLIITWGVPESWGNDYGGFIDGCWWMMVKMTWLTMIRRFPARHGATPIAGGLIHVDSMENPIVRNGWWLGVLPPWLRKPPVGFNAIWWHLEGISRRKLWRSWRELSGNWRQLWDSLVIYYVCKYTIYIIYIIYYILYIYV